MSDGSPSRIGVFGGSFNPPHVSHVLACLYALSVHPLDRILVIPSYQHPLDKALVSYEHRFAMAQLAFRHLEGWVAVSRLEEELGGISYTVDTLMELHRRHARCEFRLLVGSDILGEVHRWRQFERVRELAPLLVVPRIVRSVGDLQQSAEEKFYLPAVSSTEIREALAAGQDPGESVPLAVREYIRRHGLYV